MSWSGIFLTYAYLLFILSGRVVCVEANQTVIEETKESTERSNNGVVQPNSSMQSLNPTQYYESLVDSLPIFVLNLDRSTDRWLLAEKEMRESGLLVNRFAAVDGRELSKEKLVESSNHLAAWLQPRGVIGCYLSHRKFWQTVVVISFVSYYN